MNVRIRDHEPDTLPSPQAWEDTRTPEEAEADARAAVCEVSTLDDQEAEPEDTGMFFRDPLADWSCIVVLFVACVVLLCIVPGPAGWE